MTLKDLWNALPFFKFGDNTVGIFWIVMVILSLIQVSPIKINPWTWLQHWIQSVLGIYEIREEIEDGRRTRILRFDDEVSAKQWHKKELWDAIIIDCDKYEHFCEQHKQYVNSIAADSIRNLRETYHELKKSGAFVIAPERENYE